MVAKLSQSRLVLHLWRQVVEVQGRSIRVLRDLKQNLPTLIITDAEGFELNAVDVSA